MSRPPLMTVTESAQKRIAQLLASRGKNSLGIRVSLKTKGCSGLSYAIEFVDEHRAADEAIPCGDTIVYIEPKAVMFLIGTEMDYVEGDMETGFTFKNPNEKGRCGCGESFHV